VAVTVTMLGGVGVAALATGLATPASAVSGTALINADTVTGNRAWSKHSRQTSD